MLQAPTYGFNFRFVHVGDPIPSIPASWLGYAHLGPEYVINSDTSQPVTPGDVEVRAYTEANQDGDITPWLLENKIMDSWKAHTWYFGPVTICFNGGAMSGAGVVNPFKNDPETNPMLQTTEDDGTSTVSDGPNSPDDGTEVVEVSDGGVNAFGRLSSKKYP
jgi:hypothetical protein